jgi:hypothetical protein
VWRDQIAMHCPVPFRILDNLEDPPDDNVLTFYIINYPNSFKRERDPHTEKYTWFPVPRRDIERWHPEVVVCDESHALGNPAALQSRMCHRYGREAKFRVFMTGTMFHRAPFFIFGQMKFYDGGASFGSNFTHFRRRVAIFGGQGGFTVQRYRNLDWMMREVRKSVFIVEHPRDVPSVTNEIRFELTGKNREAYLKMDQTSVLELDDGEKITAAIVLTRHLRLLQICGGYMRRESGKYIKVGSNKIDMYSDRLREYKAQGIEKFVVGCLFLPELIAVARESQKQGYRVILFHGGVPKGQERADRIEAFRIHDGPCVFVSQVAAGSQSIDLSVASVMLHYSLSPSYLIHDQFESRIEKYKDTRTLLREYLVATGTRDEIGYVALGRKMDVAKMLLKEPKLAERIATLER